MQAQEQFDAQYIAAPEIMKSLGVTRGALLYARRVGKLPEPIVVGNGILFIWDRMEVQPILEAWKAELLKRREQ